MLVRLLRCILPLAFGTFPNVLAADPLFVDVGLNGLSFTPNTLQVVTGDQVTFRFHGSHSLTQSSFNAPCTPLMDAFGNEVGLDSGLEFPTLGNIVSYTVQITDASAPLWFFCKRQPHCNLGMVFSFNPPATGNTFTAFKTAASSATIVEPTFDSQATGQGVKAVSGTPTTTSSTTTTTQTTTTTRSTVTLTTTTSAPSQTGLQVSTNGRCGATPNSTCSGSTFGSCCSQFGFCGTDIDHCGSGCRSAYGLCGVPIAKTKDGFCGVKHRTTCEGSKFGACCSANGRCGNGSKFCGAGCLVKYGQCTGSA